MAHRGQEKSIVWRLSKINEDDHTKVTCNLCQKVLSRGGKTLNTFSTSNMKKHLKSVHPNEFAEEELAVEADNQEKALTKERQMSDYVTISTRKKMKMDDQRPSTSGTSRASSSGSQLTLKETVELKKLWDINSSQAQQIHYSIGEMIAVDCQPFSIVEDPGFQRLMKLLKPTYNLPSRKYFSTKIIPDIHAKVYGKVEKTLTEACNMSFTTDIWTNNADASFIR